MTVEQIHQTLIAASKMIADYADKYPFEFETICRDLSHGKIASTHYKARIFQSVWEKDEQELGRFLREFRKTEHVKLAAQEVLNLVKVTDTIQSLSDLAAKILDITYQFYYAQLSEKYGVPRSAAGETQALTIFGMGKLGGRELNFSSDIDLIMCFPESGETDDSGKSAPISNELFFHRVAQRMIQLLDKLDENGFVYRVDMRLKPFGSVGNLCVSFNSMRRYYLEHGRNWERYALIKMRPVAGHIEQGEKLLSELESFIYQRHVDYTAVESIDEMKKKIVTKAREQALANNLKLGNGGIREIEFIVQAYQLLYGGRMMTLRSQSLLQALDVLVDKELLGNKMVVILRNNYLFLRRVENAIQFYLDQQTHDLPESETAQNALLVALSYDSWEAFCEKVSAVRYEVYQLFQRVFATNDTADSSVEEEKTRPDFWAEQLGAVKIKSLTLASLFANFYRQMTVHNKGDRYLVRLNWMLPQVIKALEHEDNPEKVGRHMLELLEAIADQSVYLSLLVENPQVLKKIMTLFMRSSWMTKFLCEHPLVIDELVHEGHEKVLPSKTEIKAKLQHALEQTIDEQQKLKTIIDFKNSQIFRVASADLQNNIKTIHVSDQITWVAEAIIEEVLAIALRGLTEKHGEPMFMVNNQPYHAEFGVVAYGKFGGDEMGYGSDMDLLFLHNSSGEQQHTNGEKPIENELFFIRLVQKITQLLTTMTPNGKLYEVDMRLRPSGNSGMPISSLAAFEDYQMNEAWTWEHQALVRARFVAGDEGVRTGFRAIRQLVLCQTRDPEKLRQDVLQMRERMRMSKGEVQSGYFDLKQGIGGVTDIEFIVQYLLLLHAKDYRHLVRCSDNLRQLAALELFEIILSSQASELRLAYRRYRFLMHHQQLKGKPTVVDADAVVDERTAIKKIWNEVFTVEDNKLQ